MESGSLENSIPEKPSHPARAAVKIVLLWLALFVLYFFLRYPIFISALSHDDGLFLYGGQAWAHGELPYRDFWDHKPPGIFFFHSLPLRLFPFSLRAVKWHENFWLSWSAALLFVFCRRRFFLSTSLLTLGAYLVFTSMPFTIRSGGLTEENALFFVVLCFWLMLRRRGTLLRNSFFAGLSLGAAIEFRQTFVFTVAFLIGALLHNAHQRGERFRDVVRPFIAMLIGLGIPELAVSAYFGLRGTWYEYFEGSYFFNLYYIGPGRSSLPFAEVMKKQWDFLLNTGPYLIAPILATTVIRWMPKENRWMLLPLWLAFIGDMIAVSLSGEFYPHYYVQASVSGCLLLAMFFEGLIAQAYRCARKEAGVRQRWVYGFSALVLAAIPLAFWIDGIGKYYRDYTSILEMHGSGDNEYAFQQGVALAVRRLTEPDERILLIGRDPNSVYFLAGRYAASRYYHFSPLWKDKLQGAVRDWNRIAFIADVQQKKPVLILRDLKIDPSDEWRLLRRVELNPKTPVLESYLNKHYIPLHTVLGHIPAAWDWYDTRILILVRKDKAEAIKKKCTESS